MYDCLRGTMVVADSKLLFGLRIVLDFTESPLAAFEPDPRQVVCSTPPTDSVGSYYSAWEENRMSHSSYLPLRRPTSNIHHTQASNRLKPSSSVRGSFTQTLLAA